MQVIISDEGNIIVPRIPTEKERNLAGESSRQLASYVHSSQDSAIQLMKKGEKVATVVLPAAALQLLRAILLQMSKGNAVTIMPVHAELTTQEAADLLNVSRPFLVNLLEEGHIPFRRVGSRRRVLAKDILVYKKNIDNKRLAVLAKLAQQAQQDNMGY